MWEIDFGRWLINNINQKVKDLLQSKFSTLPKTAQKPVAKIDKPPKPPRPAKATNAMQESIKSASSQASKEESKFTTPSKNSTIPKISVG